REKVSTSQNTLDILRTLLGVAASGYRPSLSRDGIEQRLRGRGLVFDLVLQLFLQRRPRDLLQNRLVVVAAKQDVTLHAEVRPQLLEPRRPHRSLQSDDGDDGLAVDVLRHLGLTSEIANSFGTAARLGHEQVRRHGLLLEEQNLTLGLERTFRYSVGADDPLVLRRGLVARNEVRPPRAQGEQLLLGRLVTIDRP